MRGLIEWDWVGTVTRVTRVTAKYGSVRAGWCSRTPVFPIGDRPQQGVRVGPAWPTLCVLIPMVCPVSGVSMIRGAFLASGLV
jgi:hypothetical protein